MRWNDEREGGLRWRRPALAVVATLAAVLPGCGNDNKAPNLGSSYPVAGKVTLPDGKPLASGNIIFVGPVTGAAATQGDGTFAFKDGLPAGDYRVRVEAEAKGTAKRPILAVPARYLDEDSSDLKATVKSAESNDFDFKLTPGNDAAGKSADDRRKAR